MKPAKGLAALNLRDLWEYRELIYFLTWRDLKVRYKQTLLGFTWVILQPLLIWLYLHILVWRIIKSTNWWNSLSDFFVCSLASWTYFAASLTRSSTTLVGSANLISKVYFPRMVIPISGVISGFVDFANLLCIIDRDDAYL